MKLTAEFEVTVPLLTDHDLGDIYGSLESLALENGLELLGVITDGNASDD